MYMYREVTQVATAAQFFVLTSHLGIAAVMLKRKYIGVVTCNLVSIDVVG